MENNLSELKKKHGDKLPADFDNWVFINFGQSKESITDRIGPSKRHQTKTYQRLQCNKPIIVS